MFEVYGLVLFRPGIKLGLANGSPPSKTLQEKEGREDTRSLETGTGVSVSPR